MKTLHILFKNGKEVSFPLQSTAGMEIKISKDGELLSLAMSRSPIKYLNVREVVCVWIIEQ